jgi:hypothetical protein
MDDLNTEAGKLIVRVFVRSAEDQHGRLHGHWRTMLSQYCTATDAPEILARFKALNPQLLDINTHARFTVQTHIPI